jgi:predicted 3-demethylubiquinone-9 3-methyltransferase (glyoxalase superfamily)
MPTITPCLWFDHQAEEAVKFYVSIFKNAKIGGVTRHCRSRAPKGCAVDTDACGLMGCPSFRPAV